MGVTEQKQKKQSKPHPHQGRPTALPVRYSVRTEQDGRIEEISIGTDLAEEIGLAESHARKTGARVWVWSVKTGLTVHRIERGQRAGGGR